VIHFASRRVSRSHRAASAVGLSLPYGFIVQDGERHTSDGDGVNMELCDTPHTAIVVPKVSLASGAEVATIWA
jgi:hypothetical protein